MSKLKSLGKKGMKRSYRRASGIILVTFLFAGLGFLASCSASDSQALYEEKCNTCHNLETVEEANYSGSEWEGVVKDMQGRTTSISDDDAEKITEYLKNK